MTKGPAETIRTPNGEIRVYLDYIQGIAAELSDEACKEAAFQIEAETKTKIMDNGQFDTGFMVNSVYTVLPADSSYMEALSKASGQRGGDATDMAPQRQLPGDARAGVIVGARYAVFQENLKPFLYPSAEKVMKQFGGTIKAIYRKIVGPTA